MDKKRPASSGDNPGKRKNAKTVLAHLCTAVSNARLHCFGMNEFGQLGLQNEEACRYPAVVPSLAEKNIIEVACGGVHTLALDDAGAVWTFGVNDDKALGRHTEDSDEEAKPGVVQLPQKVVQISAGDSHSAALTENGQVYAWGCFKNDNGNYGLVAEGAVCRQDPVHITEQLEVKILKISSGAHHVAMLGADHQLYTFGAGDYGQLGRVKRDRLTRSTEEISQKEFHLTPSVVTALRNRKLYNVWTGPYSTYCATKNNRDLFVFGLNGCGQLGIAATKTKPNQIISLPTKVTSFRGTTWKQLAAGQHHVVALSETGKVYTLGRNEDGRLGIGPTVEPVNISQPTEVPGLRHTACVQIATGDSTSYAVTEDGHLYAWGFGENYQLASGDDVDRYAPTRCFSKPGTHIENKVMSVDAGGQHVAVRMEVVDDNHAVKAMAEE